ncbi:Helix-turn-helix type 11 domain protein [Methanosalsum zhilinae DSM 4017]|uniref:Helix-turn-helix type 11 domain protein n=1 Tax=Methanosalsum zhilinae (strain DSM 4017 / NBRC 107636 / OCM 62 / WeN5) TaxID=679901 RepID=F7XM07_METZD|nr:winged helix-turn-helix transcriptional regulator [Methanosalsum zhilinae]AEH60941.1 Helix-turn-helix type 11 domain protein [Methanosalsum zhilinae DSM 4017]
MIKLLHSKSGITKFQILIEIAAHQPNVRQKEIAEKIGITPQAVSEYIKELVNEGFIESKGRVRYRITKTGVEWVLENAAEMKKYAQFVMGDIISHVSTWTAIAEKDLSKGETVYLNMKNGLLYVSPNGNTDARGVTISDAKAGEDVGVTELVGLINLETASISICKVPRVERGGSRNTDLKRLKMLSESKPYIASVGVEALISLKKIGIKPDVMFGAREAVIEAAYHGLSSVVVSIDEEVPAILSRLESENLEYELVDLTLQ